MKKFLSMFLALAMCLSLSVAAFAAEEETEAANEASAQRAICSHRDYIVTHDYVVDPNNYDAYGHAQYYMEYHTCLACDTRIGSEIISTSSAAHKFRKTVYRTVLGPNGETVTSYMYSCKYCNYSTIDT